MCRSRRPARFSSKRPPGVPWRQGKKRPQRAYWPTKKRRADTGMRQEGGFPGARGPPAKPPFAGKSQRQTEILMSTYTHHTASTQFVEAAGIRFAYRRFANRRFGAKIDIPLLFFMHLTGTMDHWDPAVTDGLAQDREVILFNNARVSSSSGQVPTSIQEMAQHAAAFIDALGIKKLDALGFSMGGLIAQQFTMDRPYLVRKLI